ncbi:alpha-D-ribose 1-methylphosphonate 5-triphosphate diphosphatase [Thalassovita gelatinovora]|uniref:alpha-D-ribose 1-methylphosphonate 5-triphosphate diphosphatase n=1 Tax=Thalassovita gelatinovora TaxID=53501 RepID=UPI00071CCD8F|nr:alpha-D-ribose 1-methylphosphonate 5-triphosphate diphosphatase [Thalassovita gelatinovora]QIZ82591.1 alpha-D-ribose 1-methylphosphonate 5-triphosphate diphosphatase [Thalassovita gelatinovora]
MELVLGGAEVLLPGGLVRADLGIAGGLLTKSGSGRRIDLSGFRVLPGIVDLHGDGFERHLAPRRGAMKDLSAGLASAEAELAANGITTAYLAQFWSWEGGMRGRDFALRFLVALKGYRGLGTDLRVQLRFELFLLQDYADFSAAVAEFGVDYVVFNDHLPHQALARGKRPPRLTGQALKGGRSPEAHLAMMQELHRHMTAVAPSVAGLAADLAGDGVALGSHDDATTSLRWQWHKRGVTIAEFPETRSAAESARELGDAIVLGAPNVVRGGSHSGNISAAELVRDGLCDGLASDYHYPAPRQAALMLAEEIGLEPAWALVSQRPAQVLGLTDRGVLKPGKRADLLVLDQDGRIGATIASGRVSYLSGAVAERFLG